MGDSTASLGELIELAIDSGLADSCHVARGTVVITLGGRALTFDAPGARRFLGMLLEAWERTESGATPLPYGTGGVGAGRAAADGLVPPVAVSRTESIRDAASAVELLQNPAPTDEAYVDAVLSLAGRLRLIESYRKNQAANRIVLRTRATTTEMSYLETLEYLTGSILEELRSMNQEA